MNSSENCSFNFHDFLLFGHNELYLKDSSKGYIQDFCRGGGMKKSFVYFDGFYFAILH